MDFANVLSDAISTWGSVEVAKANQPQPYVTGQPAAVKASTGGISPVVLLAGAAVVLVVLLKD